MIWVGNRTLYVESFYNHRIRTTNEQHLEWFDSSAIRATQIKSAVIIIGGDFNLPGWDWKNKTWKPNTSRISIYYTFINTLDATGLCQVAEYSTRKRNTLDLITTNFPIQIVRIFFQAYLIMAWYCLLRI